MRLLINRIVRELESGRTFLRPDRLVHGSQCLFRIILRVIHSIYHIIIAIHLAALRHLRVFIQDMCLEQLCIITAHVIITDICLIPGSVCFLICIPGYILRLLPAETPGSPQLCQRNNNRRCTSPDSCMFPPSVVFLSHKYRTHQAVPVSICVAFEYPAHTDCLLTNML